MDELENYLADCARAHFRPGFTERVMTAWSSEVTERQDAMERFEKPFRILAITTGTVVFAATLLLLVPKPGDPMEGGIDTYIQLTIESVWEEG